MMAVLIANIFVISPCVFQCISLLRVTAICVTFVVVDRPKIECV